MRSIAFVLATVGLGMLGAAAFQLPFFHRDEANLEVERPVRSYSDLVPGEEMDIVFHVHNRSDRPRRVLGFHDC